MAGFQPKNKVPEYDFIQQIFPEFYYRSYSFSSLKLILPLKYFDGTLVMGSGFYF